MQLWPQNKRTLDSTKEITGYALVANGITKQDKDASDVITNNLRMLNSLANRTNEPILIEPLPALIDMRQESSCLITPLDAQQYQGSENTAEA